MSHIIVGTGSQENITASIINSVNIKCIEEYQKEYVVDKINAIYGGKNIYLWALPSNYYKSSFSKICPNDMILLKRKGQKGIIYFEYYGTITYTTEDDGKIGKLVWGSNKWTRLLFIKDIRKISIRASKIAEFLGYESNHYFSQTAVCSIKRGDLQGALLNMN